ncbi:MAG: ATP-binding protein [Planctomycetota bacterium]|nr:ATP-binding protein [Planctomycetota bacterium]
MDEGAAGFIGRERELAVLRELADSGRAELFVLYGRRRVGKTELLQQLCRGRRAVYFLAAQVRDRDNLRAFRAALHEGLGDPLAGTVEFPDWAAALGFAAERAGDGRLIVVLDEFPYLCEANKGLPSLVQRFWDDRGKRSRLMLVLCGSQMSFMEREVLAEHSPLFGRRTGQRRLEPLAPPETLAFFPRWSVRDRTLAYGALGGMPAYLQRFDDADSLSANIAREMLRPEGYLFDEVQFLLRAELSSPATYNSILAATARGSERVGDIALSVGIDSTTANKYLHVLRELRLVEREVPLTDPDPLRSRRGTYRILDRFVAFHFLHLQPNLSLIEAGRGGRVLEEFIQPDFPRLFDDALTDFVLDHLRREAADLVGEEIVETGRHDGRWIRALGRTVEGRGVAAVLGKPSRAALAEEIEALRPVFASVVPLSYSLTEDPAKPLAVGEIGEVR